MKKMLLRLASVFSFFAGGFLLLNATLPIAKYELFPKAPRPRKFLSPIREGSVKGALDAYPLNLVRASNWFVGAPELPDVSSKVKYYNITIPKLKIQDAVVEVAGEDLSKNLIHYRGTALPGKQGNTVIFGHSTLPQLFRQDNYLSIFSYLQSLSRGDEIFIDYDGIKYKYVVEDKFEVKPDEVRVLGQSLDDAELSLITCVPPGTYLRRLVVKARLVPPESSI